MRAASWLPFMISYAQNAEDVLLRRALPTAGGFYVDVGAWRPAEDSVTKHFYDAGWTGINIEPQEDCQRELRAARAKDTNLALAIGTKAGRAQLATFEGRLDGFGTLDEEVRRHHETKGRRAHEVTVDVRPLEDVLRQYAPRQIDFLKIDVEGREEDVLASFDLRRWAPRVIVVEATFPDTCIPSYGLWEDRIVGAGYVRTLFDGLNCFYVAEGDLSIQGSLSIPANVFDQYVPYRLWRLLGTSEQEELRARAESLATSSRKTRPRDGR